MNSEHLVVTERIPSQKGKQIKFYNNRFSELERGLEKLCDPILIYDKNLVDRILSRTSLDKTSIILEVCAGQGTDSILISPSVGDVIATDISVEALTCARELSNLNERSNISFVACDAEYLPFKEGIFDFVFCKDALHHVTNPLSVLVEVKRSLKKNGAVTVIEANALNPQMFLIGLIYYDVDKGVFKNSSKYLTKLFEKSLFHSISVQYRELLPRHILFYTKSPIYKLFKNTFIIKCIKIIYPIESRIASNVLIKKFCNYIIITAKK